LNDVPISLRKIENTLGRLNDMIKLHKQQTVQIEKEIQSLTKYMKTHVSKEQHKKEAIRSKPKGFASPVKVSPELCSFMNQPEGTLISRTKVTQYVNQYIKDNALMNPLNKKQILPNEALYALLDESAKEDVITYFNLQKYMSKHFTK
jgi:upstream activation factor subunit UAF30